MFVVECMEWCRAGPGRTGGGFVFGVCLNLLIMLFVFDAVWGRNLTLMYCSNTLQCRWWLYVYVCLMCHVGFGQTGSTFVLGCAWIGNCYCWCPVQYILYEAVISSWWCVIRIPDNDGDGGCAFMFVECLARFCVCSWPTESTCVTVCAWIWNYYCVCYCSMRSQSNPMYCSKNTLQWRYAGRAYVRWIYETVSCWPWTIRWYVEFGDGIYVWRNKVINTPWCAVQITTMATAAVLFKCMEWCPGRSGSVFVMVCAWIWMCYSFSLQYEVVISPWCSLWIHRWRLFAHLRSLNVWHVVVSVLDVRPGGMFVLLCAWIWSC